MSTTSRGLQVYANAAARDAAANIPDGTVCILLDGTGMFARIAAAWVAVGGGGSSGNTMFGELGDLDTTHSPVGLWIDGGPTDSSGNGLTLSNPGGSWNTPEVAEFAGKSFGVFDNFSAYARPAYDAILDIKGDITIQWTEICADLPELSQVSLISFGGASPTVEAENTIYSVTKAINRRNEYQMFHENAGGVNNVANIPGASVISTFGAVAHFAATRNVTAQTYSMYRNGQLIGTSVAYANNPTGGGSARLFLGGYTNPATLTNPAIATLMRNVKIVASELTQPQILAEAELALGTYL